MNEPYGIEDYPDEEELPAVVAASNMTDEIFIKHMNARHADVLKLSGEGLIDLRTSWPDQTATYRAFHTRIHNPTSVTTQNHIHNEDGE